MITPQHPLLLGSASPRRRALLQEQGLPLSVLSVDDDESARDGEGALGYLERIVDAKLEAVASRLSAGGRESWPVAGAMACMVRPQAPQRRCGAQHRQARDGSAPSRAADPQCQQGRRGAGGSRRSHSRLTTW